MTARTLPEWIARTADTPIPTRVRLRVFERAKGCCQACQRKLFTSEQWECDHIVALINGGEHRESNLQVLCGWCHSEKTKADVRTKSRVAKRRASHLGLKKPRTITRWRKMNGDPVYASRERS